MRISGTGCGAPVYFGGRIPGDPVYVGCFEHEMDRIQAGYAAMAGAGLGMMRELRPAYPATVIVEP